jgi:leucyl-tRNA synthetase
MPVDLYVGGSEHAVLHLLYARFWHKVLLDIGVVYDKEPFLKLVHQGIILGEDGQKMSKARGNVVNPDDIVAEYGADTFRIYEMFMGPLEQVKPWQTAGIEGARRFLERVWAVAHRALGEEMPSFVARLTHSTVKKVTEDIQGLRFNTAISALMILTKQLLALDNPPRASILILLRLLEPFAPHLASELWERLHPGQSICLEPWPKYDPALLEDDLVEIAVQVNGKLRASIRLSKHASEVEARTLALTSEKVRSAISGKDVAKVVYVPCRILNFVL